MRAFEASGGQITFNRSQGWSDRPIDLPCGKCPACRSRKANEWALRCVHESQLHERNSFLTLTYDNDHLPGDGQLDVTHWQKFAKRLRKARGPFRFYHCGEYGSQTRRPHYHALVFGLDFHHDQVVHEHTPNGPLYRSASLEKLWKKGHCTIGAVNYATALYVARYAMKKLDQKEYVDFETGEVMKPEYSTMSRRPGIGSGWLEKFASDVYPSDEVVYNGRKYRPPRFYDSKLPDDEVTALKDARRRSAALQEEDNTPKRLRTKENVAMSRLRQLQRDKL